MNKKVEPPNQPEEQKETEEGRKLYATKYGAKYHFERTCEHLKGYLNFEKKACRMCLQTIKEILTLSASSGSTQSHTMLGFSAPLQMNAWPIKATKGAKTKG